MQVGQVYHQGCEQEQDVGISFQELPYTDLLRSKKYSNQKICFEYCPKKRCPCHPLIVTVKKILGKTCYRKLASWNPF